MRYTINEIKNKTAPIAKAYGIGRMSLFGSYARGEAKDGSDVDLYIERGKLKSLLQYFAFVDELEDALNCHVDVVTTGIEDKHFLSAIMQEGCFCMKNEDILIIKKMIKYCGDIDTLMTRFDADFGRYKTDISFQYACNMCIIQIGELANRLSDETKECSKNIPWRAIRGMRNLHAHDYENVDLEIVWNTLPENIPALKKSLEELCF